MTWAGNNAGGVIAKIPGISGRARSRTVVRRVGESYGRTINCTGECSGWAAVHRNIVGVGGRIAANAIGCSQCDRINTGCIIHHAGAGGSGTAGSSAGQLPAVRR